MYFLTVIGPAATGNSWSGGIDVQKHCLSVLTNHEHIYTPSRERHDTLHHFIFNVFGSMCNKSPAAPERLGC